MLDDGDHAQRKQRIQLGAAVHLGQRVVVEDTDRDRCADRVCRCRRVGVGWVGCGWLDAALGAELHLMFDGGLDLQVLVGLQHCRRANVGAGVVVGESEGQRTGHRHRHHLQAGGNGLAGRRGQRADDGVEDRAVQDVGIQREHRVGLVFQAGRCTGLVFGAQQGLHAHTVGELGVDQVLGLDAVTGGTNGRVADVDGNAGPGLGLGLGELDHLQADEAVVALQVEFIDAGDDVVGLAVFQTVDRCRALVVDDRLAELEGQAQQREIDIVAGRPGLVVQGDGVLVAVDALGAVGQQPAIEVLGVVRNRRHGDGQQVHRDAVDRILLGGRQLDELRLVAAGCAGVVLERDHDIGPVVHQATDRAAPAGVVLDRVLGHQGGAADIDHVQVVVDVADLVRIGHGRVDEELGQRRAVHVRDDRAVHLGVDV